MRCLLLLIALLIAPVASAQSVRLDISDENTVLRFSLSSYSLVGSKLGDRPPEGTRFLVVRGLLENRNTQQGVDIPPAADAFPLLVNGSQSIPLHPLSADTADAFWGPQVLLPGEKRPVEFVYAVPSTGVERAEIRHLSSQGRISLYVIGEAAAAPTTALVGPVDLGEARMAVSGLQRLNDYAGYQARPGHHLLGVGYVYTNLRDMQPLETNIASLSALEADGGYIFQSLTLPPAGTPLPVETFHAGEPTPGELVFEVPDHMQQLVLVHYTEEGPLRLPLTPDAAAIAERTPIAGPSREGSIEVTVYAQELTVDGLILEVGLRLDHPDGLADMPLDLSTGFELHAGDGSFTNASPNFPGLQFPVTYRVLRRDQIDLGQLGFPGVGAGSYTLVLPLASGAVRLRLPTPTGATPRAATQSPYSPSRPGSAPQRQPGLLPSIPSPVSPAAPATPTGSPDVTSGQESPTAASPGSSTRPPPAQRPHQQSAPRDTSRLKGIPRVMDTGTLTIRWDIVPLYGVAGEGEPFRSELEGFIRDREVDCVRKAAQYRCVLEGEDLSEIVVRNGAAKALPDAPENIREAEATAKSRGAGIWK